MASTAERPAGALQPAPDDTRTQLVAKFQVEVLHSNGCATASAMAPSPQLGALQAAQALARLDAAAPGACAPAGAQPSGHYTLRAHSYCSVWHGLRTSLQLTRSWQAVGSSIVQVHC